MSFFRSLLFACLFLEVLAQDQMIPVGLNIVGGIQERMYSVLFGVLGNKGAGDADRAEYRGQSTEFATEYTSREEGKV